VSGGLGADGTLNGEGGADTVSYDDGRPSGVSARLNQDSNMPPAVPAFEAETLINFERLRGSQHSDTLTVTAGSEAEGLNGNDTLIGSAGGDQLEGGNGADVLLPMQGNDTVIGGIEGGADDSVGDTLSYANLGGASALAVNLATSTTSGNAGTDALSQIENAVGGAGGDTLTGSLLANLLDGGPGVDTLLGGAGTDELIGGSGADTLDGNTGVDTVSYASQGASVVANLTGGTGDDGGSEDGPVGDRDSIQSVENLIGTDGNDTLTGSSEANRLDGGAGNDTLVGGSGPDVLVGNAGVDTVSYASHGASVTATLNGASGDDGGSVDGPVGDRDSIHSTVENLIGTNGGDTLTGSSVANRLDGGAGNDTLVGRSGADVLVGGTGVDTVSYASHSASVTATLNGRTGDDGGSVDGPAGARDSIHFTVENLIGTNGGDTLTGSSAANRLTGGKGADRLRGSGGADVLIAKDGIKDLLIDCGVGTDPVPTRDSIDPPPISCP